MHPIPRLLAISTAVLVTASACGRKDDKVEAPAAPTAEAPYTPAAAGAPMSFGEKTQYADVKLQLSDTVKGQPDLHAPLYATAVRDLKRFAEGAKADLSEAGGGPAPYQKIISYLPAGESGKLFSLGRLDMEYTGGAHPNTTYTGVLWDKALKKRLSFGDIFRAGADLGGLERALCEAANAAKQARSPGSERATIGGQMWSCPKPAQTPFVLANSQVPGKLGGITFLIGAYDIGPYSDGAYWITIPQSVFRNLLSPAYLDEFTGEPVRKGDVTPTND